MNRGYRLLRHLSISAVVYISAVGYSANFESPVAYIADLYGKSMSYISAIGYIGE